MKLDHPEQPRRIRAQFAGWIVQEKPPKRNAPPDKFPMSEPLVREIAGPFTIEIVLDAVGYQSRYRALVIPTQQRMRKTFGLFQLKNCKEYVSSQFKKQLTEWEVIEK